ncbi:hypothetical protein DL98DRAFT_225046 [Cadophora sp. DSE1049]|nr:hypothetical protein DL98DRAFT_225046 [Cadophora sp. DSE1049]
MIVSRRALISSLLFPPGPSFSCRNPPSKAGGWRCRDIKRLQCLTPDSSPTHKQSSQRLPVHSFGVPQLGGVAHTCPCPPVHP